jgi:hypothetical protein
LSKKEKIHTRVITVNSYETGEGTIHVEGLLTDERFYPSLYYSRNKYIDPGIVHKMTVQLDIALPDLEIRQATAVMNEVPIDDCREIETFVKKLVGLRIQPGFTRKVRSLLGGVEGCLHLTNLILTMGSAAVQGFWAYFSRRREGASGVKAPGFDPGLLKDSCWLWREDGPLYARIRKLQEEKKKPEGAKDRS